MCAEGSWEQKAITSSTGSLSVFPNAMGGWRRTAAKAIERAPSSGRACGRAIPGLILRNPARVVGLCSQMRSLEVVKQASAVALDGGLTLSLATVRRQSVLKDVGELLSA